MLQQVNRLNKLSIVLSLAAVLFLSSFAFGSGQSANGITIAAIGDIGCKSASISNLKNLDAANLVLLGLGDYLYRCSSSSVQKYYDGITKFGAKGNHEDDGEGAGWAKTNFRYGDRGYGSWKYGDLGIIILDPYQSYKQGSTQYNYVKAKSEQFTFKIVDGQKVPRTDIKQIIYAVHEPLYTPTVEGGHGPNTGLRAAYGPIIKQYDGLLVQAHNHVTAFGTVDGIPQVVCGGGGYGGDSVGKLSGWEFATAKFGYCKFTFGDTVKVDLIGTDNKIIRSHTWP